MRSMGCGGMGPEDACEKMILKKLPARYGPTLFAFLLSGVMSLLVSSLAIIGQTGWVDGVLGLCVQTWLHAWGVAFVVALFMLKPVRWVVSHCVQSRE